MVYNGKIMTYEMKAEPKQNGSRTKGEALVQILVQMGSSRNLKLSKLDTIKSKFQSPLSVFEDGEIA